MSTQSQGWKLEVVRGAGVGRVLPLETGTIVVGSGLKGQPGLDLAAIELPSPRPVAARHAELVAGVGTLSIRDLESPTGTFVNRQRLLSGQVRPLDTGDVIQLGGVQLKVVAPEPRSAVPPAPARPAPATVAPAPAPPPPPSPPSAPAQVTLPAGSPLAAPYVTAGGATLRTWDDFLTHSSRNWAELREELVSGRLAAFLTAQGHRDLCPANPSTSSADERLDAWLASLPATRPANAAMEVHPPVVRLRAQPGGGLTLAKVTVTNTGYRLLRTSARIESALADWLRIDPSIPRKFTTAETTDVGFEVQIPPGLSNPLKAVVAFDGNGGTRRVEIWVDPPAGVRAPSLAPAGAAGEPAGPGLLAAFDRLPLALRVAVGAAAGSLIRFTLIAGDLIARPAAGGSSLGGAAIVLGGLGAVVAALWALRNGERGDVAPAGFAGAIAGVLLAAGAVAASRGLEPHAGPVALHAPLAVVSWAVVAAGCAAASALRSHRDRTVTPAPTREAP